MVLTDAVAAFRGALGFCSRIPVGSGEADWEAFRRRPAALPAVGYALGAIVSLPVVAAAAAAPVRIPAATVAVAFPAWLYLVTGITHLDGVADLGDAAVVHGDADRRREVLKDSSLGVGGVLALALVVVGLAAAGANVAGAVGLSAVGETARFSAVDAAVLVVAAEVSARGAAAALVCLGDAAHEGLGSALTDESGPRSLAGVALAVAPAVPLAGAVGGSAGVRATVAALVAAAVVGLLAFAWARARLGGVSGDVLGATTELARATALHAGVIAWTLS
ncbi:MULTISPECIES: adenosylcobinamide-GDP ribazoletransferase [Halorubrum]|uniref:Adenosylcobinamide-GDP ribazoletransferase n=1 Tax=Halorubrum hochstenium ATCC 700873 TaxID=1227481 RepID=M0FGV6_9EURY|nr:MULTISPECIES: adenosylcobinamide-GDP ribazoletransferase [Halorubrum]ELZ59165.1 cobalamin 5-phosphate synthase [Halorubrum hochstenium ATCC 700873]